MHAMNRTIRRTTGLLGLAALAWQPCLSCVLGSAPGAHGAAHEGAACETFAERGVVPDCPAAAVDAPALATRGETTAPIVAVAGTGVPGPSYAFAMPRLRAGGHATGPPIWLRHAAILI